MPCRYVVVTTLKFVKQFAYKQVWPDPPDKRIRHYAQLSVLATFGYRHLGHH